MSDKIDLRSQAPYYDNFDAAKDYLQVLFRPSFPVQSKELTTLQSQLLEQITRQGELNFKEGARVTGAEFTVNSGVYRLNTTGQNNGNFPVENSLSSAVFSNISAFNGLIISNEDDTVKAKVIEGIIDETDTRFDGSAYFGYITTKQYDATVG